MTHSNLSDEYRMHGQKILVTTILLTFICSIFYCYFFCQICQIFWAVQLRTNASSHMIRLFSKCIETSKGSNMLWCITDIWNSLVSAKLWKQVLTSAIINKCTILNYIISYNIHYINLFKCNNLISFWIKFCEALQSSDEYTFAWFNQYFLLAQSVWNHNFCITLIIMLKSVKRDILLCEKMHVPMRHIGILCVQQYLVHMGQTSLWSCNFFFQILIL